MDFKSAPSGIKYSQESIQAFVFQALNSNYVCQKNQTQSQTQTLTKLDLSSDR